MKATVKTTTYSPRDNFCRGVAELLQKAAEDGTGTDDTTDAICVLANKCFSTGADYPDLPRPDYVDDQMTVTYIEEWSDWFYANTETFEGELGMQLAYLWPAIIKGNQIEVDIDSAIVRVLNENAVPNDEQPEPNSIWSYIDAVAEVSE